MDLIALSSFNFGLFSNFEEILLFQFFRFVKMRYLSDYSQNITRKTFQSVSIETPNLSVLKLTGVGLVVLILLGT